MAKQYYSVLTDYGTQMIASAIARKQPLQITQMAVGDGEGRTPTPDRRRTGLVREMHRADISAISVDPRNDKQIIFELTIPENVGGFWIREMGIFDNQNRLVAYANCPDSFKPELTSGSGKVQVVRMILLVSSSDAITLKVDDSVIFATRGQLTPKTITATSQNAVDESGHSHEIDKASTSQAGIVTLDSSIDSEAENKAAMPKAVKTAYDKAVDGVNKANAAQTAANNANNNANKCVLDSVKVSNLNTLSGSQVFFCYGSAVGAPSEFGNIDMNGIHIDSGLQKFQLLSVDFNDLRYRFNDDNSGVAGAGEWSAWRRIVMREDFTQNLAATGWCRLPNGLLLQWGSGGGSGKKQFPMAFRQVYQVVESSTCDGDVNYDLDLFFNNTHVWGGGSYQTNIRYFAIGV